MIFFWNEHTKDSEGLLPFCPPSRPHICSTLDFEHVTTSERENDCDTNFDAFDRKSQNALLDRLFHKHILSGSYNICCWDTRGWFHQHFTSNFYNHRSPKRKKVSQLKQLLALLGSARIKAARIKAAHIKAARINSLMKLTPGLIRTATLSGPDKRSNLTS